MTDHSPRVEFRQVSKRFRRGTRADSLRELLPSIGRALWRASAGHDARAEFWALRDVSFRVEPGEVLGVIGPNGAGKSTLLRLLTGLLRPDAGTVHVHGRIGALIEVSAGFHPDLTGRENVFLQGAMLGLSRSAVRAHFDAIVDFAEIGDFLDTPVKRYSSGMNARLGFAIAVHAEPDVLIVDEILSVGDRAFQAKAFARLALEVQRGIPVVMVSHQLDRISSLCQRAILLSQGTVVFDGPAAECVAAYVANVHLAEGHVDVRCPVELSAMTLRDASTAPRQPGTGVTLRLHGEVRRDDLEAITVGLRIRAWPSEMSVAAIHTAATALSLPASGSFVVDMSLRLNLGPGQYRLEAVVWHTTSGQEWGRGPSVLLEVERDSGSTGSTWLAPSFEIVSS